MYTFESVEPGKLSIARAAVIDYTDGLAAEMDSMPSHLWKPRPKAQGVWGSRVYEYRPQVGKWFYQREPVSEYAALGSVAVELDTQYLIINKQTPQAQQNYHPDDKPSPVYVVHISPNGEFKYYPNGYDFQEPKVLTVQEGDVVRIEQNITHAGFNPSPNVRYTAVLYNLPPLYE